MKVQSISINNYRKNTGKEDPAFGMEFRTGFLGKIYRISELSSARYEPAYKRMTQEIVFRLFDLENKSDGLLIGAHYNNNMNCFYLLISNKNNNSVPKKVIRIPLAEGLIPLEGMLALLSDKNYRLTSFIESKWNYLKFSSISKFNEYMGKGIMEKYGPKSSKWSP